MNAVQATAPSGIGRRLPPAYRRRRLGLSIAEVLISLAITATLLTAVGAAYSASCKAVTINDQFFRASQAARICTTQLMAELRQCSIVEVAGTNRLNVVTSVTPVKAKTYTYDPNAKQLLLTVTDVNGTSSHTLGRNITSLTFSGDGTSVAMSMTVTVGNNVVAFTGSATPRRSVVYR